MTAELPPGLVYQPEFVTRAEERELLDALDEIEFVEFEMHGRAAKRTVCHFGYDYDYQRFTATPTEPIPPAFQDLQARAGQLAGVEPDTLVEMLATRYADGAGIGWHRDAPMFGTVVGISLGAPTRMRFRKGKDSSTACALELDSRSAYVLAGEVRSAWQHSIPKTEGTRYSITFRTLRKRRDT